jgi:hypothetical protein
MADRQTPFIDRGLFQGRPSSYDQPQFMTRQQQEELIRREEAIARRQEEIARRQEEIARREEELARGEEERARLAGGEEERARQQQERTIRQEQFTTRKANFTTKLQNAENQEQIIQLVTSYHKLAPTDPPIDSSKANNFLEKPDKLCGDKIDGQKCLDLLHECLEGDSTNCVEKFNETDWSKDIDVKTMNYYAARRIAEQIGFHDKTVEAAIKNMDLKVQLSEPLIAVFEAIKLRINEEEKQSISKFEVKDELKKVPSMKVRRATPIYGFVQDGGGLTSYNNLIMNLDILKTNLLMNGGGCNTSILIRSSLNTLVQLLKEQGKKIDDLDLETIHKYIFNLEKNEKKLKELREYIHILIDAISNDNYKVTNPVTLQTLEDFATKEKTIDKNIQIKIEGLHDLFNIIIRTMNKKPDGI